MSKIKLMIFRQYAFISFFTKKKIKIFYLIRKKNLSKGKLKLSKIMTLKHYYCIILLNKYFIFIDSPPIYLILSLKIKKIKNYKNIRKI